MQPGRRWLPRTAVMTMTAFFTLAGTNAAMAHVKWFCAYDLAGAPRGLGENRCGFCRVDNGGFTTDWFVDQPDIIVRKGGYADDFDHAVLLA